MSSLKVTGHIRSRLNRMWAEYDAGTCSATSLLSTCSRLYVQQQLAVYSLTELPSMLWTFFRCLYDCKTWRFWYFLNFIFQAV